MSFILKKKAARKKKTIKNTILAVIVAPNEVKPVLEL